MGKVEVKEPILVQDLAGNVLLEFVPAVPLELEELEELGETVTGMITEVDNIWQRVSELRFKLECFRRKLEKSR
jgi:hypothetical protein